MDEIERKWRLTIAVVCVILFFWVLLARVSAAVSVGLFFAMCAWFIYEARKSDKKYGPDNTLFRINIEGNDVVISNPHRKMGPLRIPFKDVAEVRSLTQEEVKQFDLFVKWNSAAVRRRGLYIPKNARSPPVLSKKVNIPGDILEKAGKGDFVYLSGGVPEYLCVLAMDRSHVFLRGKTSGKAFFYIFAAAQGSDDAKSIVRFKHSK